MSKHNYCQRKERLDDEYFSTWTTEIFPQWFSTATRTDDEFDQIDYYCTTTTGEKVNCELKGRDGEATKTDYYPAYFSGIFIEVGKHKKLLDEYEKTGAIPLFWNFFNSGNTLVIFDLRTAEITKTKWVWVTYYDDDGNVNKERVQRHELDLHTALRYYNYYPEKKQVYKMNPKEVTTHLYLNKIMKDPYYSWNYDN